MPTPDLRASRIDATVSGDVRSDPHPPCPRKRTRRDRGPGPGALAGAHARARRIAPASPRRPRRGPHRAPAAQDAARGAAVAALGTGSGGPAAGGPESCPDPPQPVPFRHETAALEEFAARIATPRLCDDVSELQAEVDAMAQAAVRNDVHATIEHSERFHRLIVEGSGNQLLYTMWSSLSITDHTALTMVTLDLDLAAVAESHQPIVDAIAAGDVELACRVSREHQAWFVELLE